MSTKRILALILTLVMCLTVIAPSTIAFAEGEEQTIEKVNEIVDGNPNGQNQGGDPTPAALKGTEEETEEETEEKIGETVNSENDQNNTPEANLEEGQGDEPSVDSVENKDRSIPTDNQNDNENQEDNKKGNSVSYVVPEGQILGVAVFGDNDAFSYSTFVGDGNTDYAGNVFTSIENGNANRLDYITITNETESNLTAAVPEGLRVTVTAGNAYAFSTDEFGNAATIIKAIQAAIASAAQDHHTLGWTDVTATIDESIDDEIDLDDDLDENTYTVSNESFSVTVIDPSDFAVVAWTVPDDVNTPKALDPLAVGDDTLSVSATMGLTKEALLALDSEEGFEWFSKCFDAVTYAWSTSAAAVADVAADGNVATITPVGAGSATITVTATVDGTYSATASFTVNVVEYVAKIADVGYETLAEAVEAAEDGDTVIVLKDITISSTITVNKIITLDATGKTVTIDMTGGTRGIRVNGGSLTIEGGTFTGINGSTGNNGSLIDLAGGSLTVNAGSFTNANTCIGVTDGTANINYATMKALDGGTCVLAIGSGAVVNIRGLRFTCEAEDEDGPGCAWAQKGARINIYSGTYNANLLGEATIAGETTGANYCLYDYRDAPAPWGPRGYITVYGGTFLAFNPADNYNHDSFLADGYVAIEDNNTWTVSKIPAAQVEGGEGFDSVEEAIAEVANDTPITVNEATTIAGEEVAAGSTVTTTSGTASNAGSGDAATTVTPKTVTIAKEGEQDKAVNVYVVAQGENSSVVTDAVDRSIKNENVEANDLVKVANVLATQVATNNAIDADKVTEIEISVKAETKGDAQENAITYEVDPYATIKQTGAAAHEVKLTNDDLADDAVFTFHLDVTAITAAVGDKVKATHTWTADATAGIEAGSESAYYTVEGEAGAEYIVVTTTHFSTWAVETTNLVPGAIVAEFSATDATPVDSYATLSAAFAGVASGNTLVLLQDVEISSTVRLAKAGTYVIDGDGYTISMASGASFGADGAIVFGAASGTTSYTLTNVTISDFNSEILRIEGCTLTIDNVTFENNNITVDPGRGKHLLRLAASVAIQNCIFQNNTVSAGGTAYGLIYIDDTNDSTSITNCLFKGNTAGGNALVYSAVAGTTIDKCTFESNTFPANSERKAILYHPTSVTNSLFINNTVNYTNSLSAGIAIMGRNNSSMSGNAFVGNQVLYNGSDAEHGGAKYVTGWGSNISLTNNYWDGTEPTVMDGYAANSTQYGIIAYYEDANYTYVPYAIDYTKNSSDYGVTVTLPQTYNVWVGGKQIDEAIEDDVFGDGKVSYDPSTNTLTLDGYTYSGAGYGGSAIYATGNLNIVVKGTNALTSTAANGFGIYTGGTLAVTGTGTTPTLNVTAASTGYAIKAAGASVELENVTMALAGNRGIVVNENNDSDTISITDSTITFASGMDRSMQAWNGAGDASIIIAGSTLSGYGRVMVMADGATGDANVSIIDSSSVTLTAAYGIQCESYYEDSTVEIDGSNVTITATTSANAAINIGARYGAGKKATATITNNSEVTLRDALSGLNVWTWTDSGVKGYSVVNVTNSTLNATGYYYGLSSYAYHEGNTTVTITNSTASLTGGFSGVELCSDASYDCIGTKTYRQIDSIVTVTGGYYGLDVDTRTKGKVNEDGASVVIIEGGSLTSNGGILAAGDSDDSYVMISDATVGIDMTDADEDVYSIATNTLYIDSGSYTITGEDIYAVTGNITGGYFTTDVTDSCAEGYGVFPNTDANSATYPYKVLPINGAVACIETIYYASLAEAVAAVPTDDTETTITMLANEALTSGLTIAAGKNIVLELAGHIVSGIMGQAGTSALITNRGTLTVQDNTDTSANGGGNGKLTNVATNPDTGDVPGYASNLITNNGTFILASGLLESKTNAWAAYAVDNQTNGGLYTPVFTMNGGRLYSQYTDAVRLFLNSDSKLNKVVINGGVLDSDKASGRVVVMHDANAKANKGELIINGGTINGAVNAWSAANAGGVEDRFSDTQYAQINIEIKGGSVKKLAFTEMANTELRAGTLKVTGGYYNVDPTEYVAAGYEVITLDNTATGDDLAAYNAGFTYKVVEQRNVASVTIGGTTTNHTTLADAIAAANEAESPATITLLKNYDMETNEPGYGWTSLSHSARKNFLDIDDNVTFDLNGKVLSNIFNNTFRIVGDDVTVQNGTMQVGTYTNGTSCSYVMYVEGASDFVVNNLTTYGGINVSDSTAEINNLSFSGTSFYAVCSQDGAEVTLNGGTYNKAIPGAASYLFWVEDGSTMNITGGTYIKGSANFRTGVNPVITGGVFDFDPTNFGVAEGYEAVRINDPADYYQVGIISTADVAPAAVTTEGYEATYTATKTVTSTDGENTTLASNNAVIVNVKTSVDNTLPAYGTDTTIGKITTDAKSAIVAEAIGLDNTGATTYEVNIAVVGEVETDVDSTAEIPTITYEVHPIATVKAGATEIGSFPLTNDQIDGSFIVRLTVPNAIKNASTTGYVNVKHISQENDSTETTKCQILGEADAYYVELTVTHFSEFELEPVTVADIGTAKVKANLTLEDEIKINFKVYPTTGEESNFSVRYSFNGAEATTQVLTSVDSKKDTNNETYFEFTVASCAAKQMTDTVIFELLYNDQSIIDPIEYSIQAYCVRMINKNNDAELVALCRTVLDYGASAQEYFGYKTDNLANADGYGTGALEDVTVPAEENKLGLNLPSLNEGISKVNANLTLLSATELNFKLTAENVNLVDISSVTSGDQEATYTTTISGDVVIVKVTGIAAKYLDHTYTLTFTYNGVENSIGFSPTTYAYRNQTKTDGLGTLSKALYNYWYTAKEYLN